MRVTILSDPIALLDVIEGLGEGGIVVLMTTRTHAEEISAKVDLLLGEQESDCGSALLQSVVEPEEGWTEFLYCPRNVKSNYADIESAVVKALQRWRNRGSSDQV